MTYTVGGDQKRRSRAVTGGDTTKYRYGSGWDVLNEESGAGTLEATYVHHPGKQIGTVLATSAGTTASTGTWAYYFQDAIGSTRGLWDEEGDRIGKYDYTPFGGKYSDSGEDITRKFTGHDWDSAARLYYTAYRYYSPDANRWLTRDPLGMVDGPNVYAYVMGNPVTMWDALGKFGCNGPGTGGTGGGLSAADLLTAFELITCMLGIAVMYVTAARATGGPNNSISLAFRIAASAAVVIASYLWVLASNDALAGQFSAVRHEVEGLGIGLVTGGAIGGLFAIQSLTGSITLGAILIDVLLLGMSVPAITAAGCVGGAVNLLVRAGAIATND